MSAPRIKDASFVQLHIEKIILSAGVLIFAIGLFLFVLGNPFAIQLNNQTYETPGDAVNTLTLSDDRLERGLQEPKPIPEIELPDFRENFLAMMKERSDSELPLAALSDPGITLGGIYPDIPEPSRYALVYPPVPKDIKHVSDTDVLDKEFDVVATKKFFELWGKDLEEPGDFTMFIAAGEFDIYEWVTRLKAESEVEGDIKIPAGIWAQRFGIAGVALLREEFDPQEARWTNRQIVHAMPNQYRMLPDVEAPIETNAALVEIAKLREGQIELAQPDLPWLDGFVQAIAPGDETQGVGVDGLLLALNAENLGPKEKEILKLEEKIKQLEARRAKQAERRNPRPDARPDARPDNFDRSPAPRGDRPARKDPIQENIDNLRTKIERLRPTAEREKESRRKLAEEKRLREEERARREALRADRDRSVFGPGEDPLAAAGVAGMQLTEGSTLRVWAADPSMRPGKTYRYKLLVSVINPLYAVPRLAEDQLKDNRSRAALLPTDDEIEAMSWIGPIKVEPKSRFFFTSGGTSASIDIYRRHKGVLIHQDFKGSPGDSIGTIEAIEDEFGNIIEEIDMGVGAVLVDIERHRDPLSTGSTINSMIYMDAEGNIFERIESLDKNSPERKEASQELKDGPKNALRPAPGAAPGDGFDRGFERGFGPGGP